MFGAGFVDIDCFFGTFWVWGACCGVFGFGSSGLLG